MKVKWLENKLGFTWSVGIAPNEGIIKAKVQIVNTRNGLRVIRSLYIVPKRGSNEEVKELFTEWYTIDEFSSIVNAELILLSQFVNPKSNDMSWILSQIDYVIQVLSHVKSKLGEIYGEEKK